MATHTVMRPAPEKRRRFHTGDHEEHFPEASIMVAFAAHLLELGAKRVELHLDGMHAKQHDVEGQLSTGGFLREDASGATCAGNYKSGESQLTIDFRAGKGDVVAVLDGVRIVAECKGGIVNTRHAGQTSRLREHLCEAVGQLMGHKQLPDERHVAVVPHTPVTLSVAARMAERAARAGIELALVGADGKVVYVPSPLASLGDPATRRS
jgi:hypothetical protein